MKYLGLLLFLPLVTIPHFCFAHIPSLVSQSSLLDITQIEDPEVSRAYYGELNNFPHTYEIRSSEPFNLFVEITVPDIKTAKNNVSGIIVKELPRGGVEEIARLEAKTASWESFFEPFGGDSYRRGSQFEGEVEPGVYRIEVHTPDNLEKYVLVVGKTERFGDGGIINFYKKLVGIKVFFDKSPLRVVESPFVYVPLSVILILGFLWFRKRSKVGTDLGLHT